MNHNDKQIDRRHNFPKTAMLLAAGFGTRLQPLTNNLPKPLIQVAGRTLLQHGLDILAAANIERIVINTHYLANKLCAFVEGLRSDYPHTELIIIKESDKLLDSAGGIINALPFLGREPFFVLNADSFWREKTEQNSNLQRLNEAFNRKKQDMLLLTVPREQSLMPQKGDFLADTEGHLSRAGKNNDNPQAVIYTGCLIINPVIFDTAPSGKAQSLNFYFDKAIARRRLYGLNLEGTWYSVGSIAQLQAAETRLTHSSGR